ncbi:MAG: beta-lactamase family protein [Chloroflexi bacterium]|jgi:D-alanyl-D-alanine carboxypeptidase|nr:beta-lactamase family protein [Chloroflexota bacterium]MBT5627395.1 beta-lactamase family protein [Chloroflexota bacterium]
MDHRQNIIRKPAAPATLVLPAFLLIVLTIISCSSNGSDGDGRLSPESIDQVRSDLQIALDDWRDGERITGATISVFAPAVGEINLASGFSKLSIDRERFPDTPLAIDQPMFVGDLTHLLIASAVIQLNNEEKLDLQQSIETWFPNIENSSLVTIRNLLEHTSGIPVFYTEEFLDVLYERSPNTAQIPDDVIAIAAAEGSFFQPGSQYGYSKTNYIVLGRIIERITGSTLETELRNRFFEPLGMNDTYLAAREEIPGGFPLGYEYAGLTSDAPTAIDGHVPQTPTISVVSAEWASGGLVSTTQDLIKLVKGIFESDIYGDVRYELIRPAVHPAQSGGATQINSGAGVFVWDDDGDLAVGQFGFIYPFSAQFIYWPESEIVIALIANEVDSSRNPNSNFQLPVIENLTMKAKAILDGD